MFTQSPLPYEFDALEPVIDAKTMELHYSKHHQGYTQKLNQALADHSLAEADIETIFSQVSELPMAVRNNGGGYHNHLLFWQSMVPVKESSEQFRVLMQKSTDGGLSQLKQILDRDFGSIDKFKHKFSQAAETQFGSGWAWLVKQVDGKLVIGSTSNQDSPLMDDVSLQGQPLLLLDVWEHAYYLKYQNRRVDYVANFWQIVSWSKIAERLEEE